jgi:hypothetical protein
MKYCSHEFSVSVIELLPQSQLLYTIEILAESSKQQRSLTRTTIMKIACRVCSTTIAE